MVEAVWAKVLRHLSTLFVLGTLCLVLLFCVRYGVQEVAHFQANWANIASLRILAPSTGNHESDRRSSIFAGRWNADSVPSLFYRAAGWQLGLVAVHENEIEAAAELWRKSWRTDEFLSNAAAFYLDRWRIRQATAAFTALQLRSPDSSCGWYYAGLLERRQWHLERALYLLERASQLEHFEACEGGRADVFVQLGIIARRRGLDQEAAAYFEQSLTYGQSLDAELGLLEIAMAERLDGTTERRLSELAQRYPDRLEPRIALFQLYFDGGQFAKARDTANELVQMAPMNGYLYYLRGRVNHALGDATDAVEDFETALERDPKSSLYAIALADALVASNQYAAAVQVVCAIDTSDSTAVPSDALQRYEQLWIQLDAASACSVE